jgi:hypothetical protein
MPAEVGDPHGRRQDEACPAGREVDQPHRDPELAEEGEKVQAQENAVTLVPARAAMALGDDLVFLEELFGNLPEELFRFQETGVILAAQLEIPILGDLLGQGRLRSNVRCPRKDRLWRDSALGSFGRTTARICLAD